MTTLNFRSAKRNEQIAGLEIGKGESCFDAWAKADAKVAKATGKVGQTGEKFHFLRLIYVQHNGENVIINAESFCGSQRGGAGARVDLTGTEVTCKKCQAKGDEEFYVAWYAKHIADHRETLGLNTPAAEPAPAQGRMDIGQRAIEFFATDTLAPAEKPGLQKAWKRRRTRYINTIAQPMEF